MNNFKTTETLNKYSSLIGNSKPTNEEINFVHNIELELAKSLIEDFGIAGVTTLGKILMAMSEK